MLKLNEACLLLEKLKKDRPNDCCYLAIPLAEGTNSRYIKLFMQELKSAGFRSMLRTTEFGNEIVVTDKTT